MNKHREVRWPGDPLYPPRTMNKRTDVAELTWRDKPVTELSREELIELVGVLHDIAECGAENFEALLRKQWEPKGTA